MRAHYNVELYNNRQKQLRDVIDNFEFTGACGHMLFRRLCMELIKCEENGEGMTLEELDNLDPDSFVPAVSGFAKAAISMASLEYLKDSDTDDEDDAIIDYDGTVAEFEEEFDFAVLTELSMLFEREFVDFTYNMHMSRAEFESAAAMFFEMYQALGWDATRLFLNTKGEST